MNTKARRKVEDTAIRKLAHSIAVDLMTDCPRRGETRLAATLRMFDESGREMSGWGLEMLARRIEKHLNGEIES